MEIGKRVKIVGTNSFWDNKEGMLEAFDEEEGRCTVFVDFNPEQGKKIRQDFNLENIEELDSLQEALKDKSSGKVGDLIKDYKNGYGLFQANDGTKLDVAIDDLEEVSEDELETNYALDVITTPSFDEDFNDLSNPKEAEWFLDDNKSNSLLILKTLGIEETIKAKKAKVETISNNNKYKGGVTVYSLFKGLGSSNQFRAYFYRDGKTCIFVRCLLKKQTKNSNDEDKAIKDTIKYALEHKNIDKK